MPPTPACGVCGARPTVRVVLAALTGVLLGVGVTRHDGRYCRDCGIALFRETTAHTLAAGWWSLSGLFLTPLVAVMNCVQRIRLGLLAAPRPGPGRPPVRPGRPVLRRVGPWVGTLLVPTLLVVAVVLLS